MLTEKDTQFLYEVKNKIVKTHKKCNGEGYFPGDDRVEKCECMRVLAYVIGLKKSNIPMDYWNLDLNQLKIKLLYKQKAEKYIKNIDNAISRGTGIFICSPKRGVGKTSLACEIAKKALTKRYNVYYNIMSVIVSDTFTDQQEIIEKIKSSDLVIIDEMDKVVLKKESGLSHRIENFLREILPAGKPVIICSNMALDELDEKIEIGSLIQRYMILLSMEGSDFSQEKNKTLEEMLNNDFDYFSKTMITNANLYHENEMLFYQKEHYRNMV